MLKTKTATSSVANASSINYTNFQKKSKVSMINRVPIEVNIPHQMKSLNQWLFWKLRNGKKIPLNTTYNVTDPTKGFSFSDVVEAYNPKKCNGLGFVVGSNVVCVDIDHCINNGEVSELAEQLADELDTYAELSQSGTGIHLFYVDNEIPEGFTGFHKTIEVYAEKHYIAMTGISISNPEIAVLNGKTAELIQRFNAHQKQSSEQKQSEGQKESGEESSVDNILKQLKNWGDPKLKQLFFEGDTTGYPSQSEADAELMIRLALLTDCNKKQMRELFTQSALGKRNKWVNRIDYQNLQINNAVSFVQTITDINLAQKTIKLELEKDKLDISTVYSEKFLYSLAACNTDEHNISTSLIINFYEKCKKSHIPINGNKGIKKQIVKYTNTINLLQKQIKTIQSSIKLSECIKNNTLKLPTPFEENPIQLPNNIIFDWENHRTLEITGDGYQHPLFESINLVIESSKNIQTNREKITVATLKHGINYWTYSNAEREIFSSKQKIITLSTEGLDVDSNTSDKMVKYLRQFETANILTIPRIKVVSQTGWINNEFVYPCGNSKYQLDNQLKSDLKNIYKSVGSKENINPVIKIIKQQPIANIVLGATLAAPLVYYLNCGNIVLHIYGLNGSGKSTITKFAFSLFGNPSARNSIPTADATKVGLEYYFAGRHDLPSVIDDLHSVSDLKTQSLMNKLPYQFYNGEGRLRGNTKGSNQTMVEYRGSLITNSEKPLTTFTSEGGSKRRVIELQTPNEMFDLDTVALIHDTFENNYGLMGAEWIQTIQTHVDYIKSVYDEIKKQLIHEFPDKVPQHMYSLAAIYTANVVFDELCLGNCDETEETKQLLEIIQQLPSKIKISDYTRVQTLIREWIISHPKNFGTGEESAEGYETYGLYRDGYVAVFPMYLRQLLNENNMSPEAIIKQLADDGFILCNSQHYTKLVKINGTPIRMFVIPFSKLSE